MRMARPPEPSGSAPAAVGDDRHPTSPAVRTTPPAMIERPAWPTSRAPRHPAGAAPPRHADRPGPARIPNAVRGARGRHGRRHRRSQRPRRPRAGRTQRPDWMSGAISVQGGAIGTSPGAALSVSATTRLTPTNTRHDTSAATRCRAEASSGMLATSGQSRPAGGGPHAASGPRTPACPACAAVARPAFRRGGAYVVAGGEPTRTVVEVLGTCAPPAATNEPLPRESPQAGRSFLLRRTGHGNPCPG
jgi:hypothetical protein